ncbi:Ribosome biogenesis protein BRX1 [Smittium mucronatum]|uniref:Ribosome biogenesis protein BRX1 n=1 Tax=Smittium mucronatum TaxID=133383 RepID=A0A1R0H2X0_9FUNG|nr:Ribosome biogenesis protein BRX1 [Smittium mucronatum]
MASIYKKFTNADSSADHQQTPKNKQRIFNILLEFSIIYIYIYYRHRHLIKDLEILLPQSKKDSKLDTKKNLDVLNELAELNNCNNVLFFEARRHEDLYLWASRAPSGPSIKFHVLNIHTMSELKLTGNCLKGSRPILSFDSNFDSSLPYQLVKTLFEQIFSVPIGTRKSKPFFDHVMSFSIIDDKVWVRNYQISEKDPETGSDTNQLTTLVEIGPRFVLNVIRIFEGSFNGRTLFENPEFNTPTAVKSAIKRLKSAKYNNRVTSDTRQKMKEMKHSLPQDPLDNVFK